MWDGDGGQNTYLGATESVILPMEWVVTEAMRNPKVMERARAELDQEVGRDRMCTEADVPKLHYIRAMVTESMRLHPSAPLLMPRETTADCRIAGYDVPANTRVLVNTYAIGRDPANWDDPLQFNPERFLDRDGRTRPDSDGIAGTGDFRMLPFGAGRRLCPGINIGMAIVYLAVASLLHSFDWSVTSSDALDLAEGLALSNPKRVPLRALARPCLAPAVFCTVPAAPAVP